jgi:hypothetical protein
MANDSTPGALRATLSRIERDHPGWHTWIGVGGLLYARRLMSSPPVVYRTADPSELETRICEHEGQQR